MNKRVQWFNQTGKRGLAEQVKIVYAETVLIDDNLNDISVWNLVQFSSTTAVLANKLTNDTMLLLDLKMAAVLPGLSQIKEREKKNVYEREKKGMNFFYTRSHFVVKP